ncbi:MAG: CFI-box-CTERM domain-containing protein [Eubacteriales bacterium]|nr:CFI-box-CTERM domain-containing protein [Eubacteriales bacterium]
MENVYLTALHGMEGMFPAVVKPSETFKKSSYGNQFRGYYEEKLPVFEALEEGYNNALDKEQYILNMAEALVQPAAGKISAVTKRGKQEGMLVDYNMFIVVYVLPSILEFKGNSSRPLADQILACWKQQFPKANLSAASFEDIEAGFHKKWCYITTAVCETFGKPDNCYELTVLRNYRDGYLMSQPEGEEIIREYYDVAPTIVKRINKRPDKKAIYRNLWDTYLAPCITMIENDENESCKELYMKMVRDLQEKYFYDSYTS